MLDNLFIREAKSEDAEEMIRYINLVNGQTDNMMLGANEFLVPEERVRAFINRMHKSSNSVIFIALNGKRIIARASLEGYPQQRTKHRAKLSISVDQAYWRRGIGSQMMTATIMKAKEMSIKVIELEVLEDNKDAIALYEKMGFEVIGTYKNYFFIHGVYKDALLMNLNL